MDFCLKDKKAVEVASSKGIEFAFVRSLLDEGVFVLMDERN